MRARVTAVLVGLLTLLVPAAPAIAGTPPSPASSSPQAFTVVGDTLFFTADDGRHGRELWRSDGTAAGTVIVSDIAAGTESSNPRELTAFGDRVCFSANDRVSGRELWCSDGTETGTRLVRDVMPGGRSAHVRWIVGSHGSLWFSARDGQHGDEPWVSDGTRRGTALVRDVRPGELGSSPRGFAAGPRGTLFLAQRTFRTCACLGVGLWNSDGTGQGTGSLMRLTGASSPTPFPEFVPLAGRVFLTEDVNDQLGPDLLVTDGTRSGSTVLGPDSVFWLTPVGARLFYFAGFQPSTLDVLDPVTLAGLGSVTPNPRRGAMGRPAAFGDLVMFGAGDGPGGATGIELWIGDGTPEGTSIVSDINGPHSSFPSGFTPLGEIMLFRADGGHQKGFELWKTDGTEAGTVLVKDIDPVGASSPTELTPFGGLVVFAASDGQSGVEPWITDGTAAGTFLLRDLA